MGETLKEVQSRQQFADIVSIQKDVQYMRESMDRNFKDHDELKLLFMSGLKEKVGKTQFRPVEMISYGLAGGILSWALWQFLQVVQTAKALF